MERTEIAIVAITDGDGLLVVAKVGTHKDTYDLEAEVAKECDKHRIDFYNCQWSEITKIKLEI